MPHRDDARSPGSSIVQFGVDAACRLSIRDEPLGTAPWRRPIVACSASSRRFRLPSMQLPTRRTPRCRRVGDHQCLHHFSPTFRGGRAEKIPTELRAATGVRPFMGHRPMRSRRRNDLCRASSRRANETITALLTASWGGVRRAGRDPRVGGAVTVVKAQLRRARGRRPRSSSNR